MVIKQVSKKKGGKGSTTFKSNVNFNVVFVKNLYLSMSVYLCIYMYMNK